MQPGEWAGAARRPQLFGQGDREMRGTPKAVPIGNPAAGADWQYTHSGPSWFLVRAVSAQLVTAVAVANRSPRLQLTMQSVVQLVAIPSVAQAASLTVAWVGNTSGMTSTDASVGLWGLPDTFILRDGAILKSSTLNIQGADAWSGIALLVEEFTDDCLDLL
jgi:hypothetical protein